MIQNRKIYETYRRKPTQQQQQADSVNAYLQTRCQTTKNQVRNLNVTRGRP